MAQHHPFCTLSRFKLLQVDQGSSVPLAKCSFGMIPLSRHSVDCSPRAYHSSTRSVVRASCFELLSAFVDSRKLFLDGGSLCLAGRWPWSAYDTITSPSLIQCFTRKMTIFYMDFLLLMWSLWIVDVDSVETTQPLPGKFVRGTNH